MNTIVLANELHIKALGIFRTFSKQGEEVRWHSRECAHKFLVVNDRLVIAPIGDHSELYAVFSVWDEPADEAKPKVSEIAKAQWGSRNYSITAAGKIGTNGQITGWTSECYRIETPAHLREEIEREVTRLFQAGALNPT